MTVEEVKAEVQLLNLDNIKRFPIKEGKMYDFYAMWQRLGPQAARDIMIPTIWEGACPRPSEYFNVPLEL